MAKPILVFKQTKQPSLGNASSISHGGDSRAPGKLPRFSSIKGGAESTPTKRKQSPKIHREGNVIFADFGKKEPLSDSVNEEEKEHGRQGKKTEMSKIPKSSGDEYRPLFELQKQTSRSRGLRNMRRGKFDPLWMVKWHMWYQYVIAMNKKPWQSSLSTGRLLTQSARAETARIAWA
ncbi:MAG: hypothetical protein ACLFUZ_00635 [Candidatus Micrarchaeia archaeon]